MIIIDYKDRRPIYEQIVDRFKEQILKGIIEPDSQLPSVRSLAMDLSINPNTIQRAYMELERQGFIYSVKGKGSFIAVTERLIIEKRGEIFKSFDQLVQEAESIGISQEQLISRVNAVYKEERGHD